LLPTLKAHKKNQFQRFVIKDQGWFPLEFHHSTKWSESRDDVTQKVKQKIILTVIRGINGSRAVDLMTEHPSDNTQHFFSDIL
jgi:hypothetical protein